MEVWTMNILLSGCEISEKAAGLQSHVLTQAQNTVKCYSPFLTFIPWSLWRLYLCGIQMYKNLGFTRICLSAAIQLPDSDYISVLH